MRRLSPGRILAAIRRMPSAVRARLAGVWQLIGRGFGGLRARLAGFRYVLEDVLYVLGRFLRRAPRATARGAVAFWRNLGVATRRRLLAALGAVAALLAFFALAAPQLPCGLPGAEPCPPPDSAEDLVPAGALAYLHVDLDSEREQVAAAEEILARIPAVSEQLLGDSLQIAPGRPLTLPEVLRDIQPWLGEEAALALVPASARRADPVWLLAVDDTEGATAFAEQVTGEDSEADEYREVEIEADPDGEIAAARVREFLAVGPAPGVRTVIDVATEAEDASSLADDPAASETRDELPPERLADAYLTREGAERLAADDGPLASLAPLLAPEWTLGVGIAVSAEDGELELTIRSALESERPATEPGVFAAFAPFEPELPARLPEGSLAYAGFGSPEETVRELLALATADAPGIASGFEGLAEALRRDGAVDIERQLLPALGEEAAFAIQPRDPEAQAIDPAPFLELVARDVDAEQVREALARLQGPVIEAIEPTVELQAPVFTELEVGGVEAQSLRISPTIELTHAAFDDLAVIATDPAGVAQLADGEGGLDDAELYERATAEFAEELSLLVFADLGGLTSAVERLGLAADPAYALFAEEVRSLHGFGLSVRLDEDLLATHARLIVGEPREAEVPFPTPAPEPEPELPPELEAPPGEPPLAPEDERGPALPPELEVPGLTPPERP